MSTKKEWKWGYIDRDGEMVIAAAFDDAWDFHDGLAAVKVEWARGYIDRDGKFVISPRFEKAGPFFNGVAKVTEDGEVRFINKDGKYVEMSEYYPSEEEYDVLPNKELLKHYFDAGGYSEGLAPVKKSSSGKWGFVNEEGKIVIKPQFRQAGSFSEGLAPVLVQV